MSRVVGLTGGIATGKSSVGRILQGMGVVVLDADEISREVVRPGEPALAEIVRAFGPEILEATGALDRKAMRARIVADEAARKTLEGITHPRIYQRLAEKILESSQRGHSLVVVEAALMVETGSYRNYPVLIVVSCDPQLQIERVMARDGVPEAQARQILAAQLPMADKEKVATYVIRNEGSMDELAEKTRAIWGKILATL